MKLKINQMKMRKIYIKEISLMKKYFSKPLRRYMYIYMKSVYKVIVFYKYLIN